MSKKQVRIDRLIEAQAEYRKRFIELGHSLAHSGWVIAGNYKTKPFGHLIYVVIDDALAAAVWRPNARWAERVAWRCVKKLEKEIEFLEREIGNEKV